MSRVAGYRGPGPGGRAAPGPASSAAYPQADSYRKPVFPAPGARKSYTMSHHNGGYRAGLRSRNLSGDARPALDYASDTEAVQSPPRSVRSGRLRSSGAVAASARSNSLPRTFNREALLRHPELSMEMDRLSDTMSEIGDRLSVSARLSHRGQ